jgi:hypothetical protein
MTVINLNRYRKKKEREAARKQADANAQKHGRTKADRARDAAENEKLEDALDGAKREPED